MTTLATSLSFETHAEELEEDALGEDEPHVVRTLKGHRGAVNSVAFSRAAGAATGGGTVLASGGQDACVMLWQFGGGHRAKRPARAYRFIGHSGPVHKVCFSPDGSVLASASADRTVRLWQPTARGHSVEVKGNFGGGVRCVDFTTDGRRLLTASDDKSVKVWSLPSRKFVCTLGTGVEDHHRRGSGSGGGGGHSHWVRTAKWAPDARVCASGGDDKTVKLWDVERRVCARTFFEHESTVRDVAFSCDGTCVVSGGDDAKVNVWDARSRTLLQHYAAHDGPVTSVAFDQHGFYLASASEDGTLKLYDLREGQLLYTLRGHAGAVGCCAFDHSGGAQGFFASGGADRVVMMWQANLDNVYDAHCAPQHLQHKNAHAPPPPPPPSKTRFEAAEPRPKTAPNHGPPPPSSLSKAHHPRTAAFGKQPDRPPPSLPPSTTAASYAYASSSSHGGHHHHLQKKPPHQNHHQGEPPSFVIEELAGEEAASEAAARAPFFDMNHRPVASAQNPGLGGAPTVDRGMLPEVLATTLDHIVGQLDIITTTLAAFEQRLTITEERVATILGVHNSSNDDHDDHDDDDDTLNIMSSEENRNFHQNYSPAPATFE